MPIETSRRRAPAVHPKRARTYSLASAIEDAAEHGGELTRGYEAEIHQEIRIQRGSPARGFYVPWNEIAAERRDLGFSGDQLYSGAGAARTDVPPMLVDVLRAKLAVERLGGKIETLATAAKSLNVQIPVKIQAAQISWVREGQSPQSQENLAIASATFVPHTATAFTDVTRRMLKLGQPDFEHRVTDDLLTGLAVAIDQAAINGTGTAASGAPLGLLQRMDVQRTIVASDSGNGGAPAWSDLAALEKLVGDACGDAPADARVGFLTSPAGRSVFRRTPELGASGVRPAWRAKTHRHPRTGDLEVIETCLGYPALATINVPSDLTRGNGTGLTEAVLGNFGDLTINLFTCFDVLVNPFLQSTNGVVRVSAFVDVDAAIMRQGSFAILDAINPA